jgi:hypothetical protein
VRARCRTVLPTYSPVGGMGDSWPQNPPETEPQDSESTSAPQLAHGSSPERDFCCELEEEGRSTDLPSTVATQFLLPELNSAG